MERVERTPSPPSAPLLSSLSFCLLSIHPLFSPVYCCNFTKDLVAIQQKLCEKHGLMEHVYFIYFQIHTQPNLTTLHLLFDFFATSWWVIWSKHTSKSDTLRLSPAHFNLNPPHPLKLSPTLPHFGDIHPPLLLPLSPFRRPVSPCLLAFARPPAATYHPVSDYLSDYLLHILSSLRYSSTLPPSSPPAPPGPPNTRKQIVVPVSSPLQSPGHSLGFKLHLADL